MLSPLSEDPVGSPGHQGQNATGPWKDGARTGREEPRGVFAHFTFSALCLYLLFFFLFNRLAAPALLLRPPGSLPTAPRAPSSTSSPVPLPWLNWLCQELDPLSYSHVWSHAHQHGCEFIVSLQLPQRIHSIPSLLLHLGPHSGSVLASLSVSVQPDWL